MSSPTIDAESSPLLDDRFPNDQTSSMNLRGRIIGISMSAASSIVFSTGGLLIQMYKIDSLELLIVRAALQV